MDPFSLANPFRRRRPRRPGGRMMPNPMTYAPPAAPPAPRNPYAAGGSAAPVGIDPTDPSNAGGIGRTQPGSGQDGGFGTPNDGWNLYDQWKPYADRPGYEGLGTGGPMTGNASGNYPYPTYPGYKVPMLYGFRDANGQWTVNFADGTLSERETDIANNGWDGSPPTRESWYYAAKNDIYGGGSGNADLGGGWTPEEQAEQGGSYGFAVGAPDPAIDAGGGFANAGGSYAPPLGGTSNDAGRRRRRRRR